MTATRIDHVGLNVAELDAAVAWYSDVLDMTEEFRFALEGVAFKGVLLISESGDRLELISRTGAAPGIQAANPVEAALTLGYSHFAIRVDDVTATYQRLVDAGASDRMSPRPGPERGMPMAFVADPEGNLIEILSRT